MRIIVVGCGRVGRDLSLTLVREGHHITVIDPDREWVVTEEGLASKSKNSPWLGDKMKDARRTPLLVVK